MRDVSCGYTRGLLRARRVTSISRAIIKAVRPCYAYKPLFKTFHYGAALRCCCCCCCMATARRYAAQMRSPLCTRCIQFFRPGCAVGFLTRQSRFFTLFALIPQAYVPAAVRFSCAPCVLSSSFCAQAGLAFFGFVSGVGGLFGTRVGWHRSELE